MHDLIIVGGGPAGVAGAQDAAHQKPDLHSGDAGQEMRRHDRRSFFLL